MNTRQYLEQVKRLDSQIANKLKEIHNLRLMVGSIGSINDAEKVITSPTKDKIGDIVAKITDMEREVDFMVDKRWKIVTEIETVKENDSYDILARVYVLGQDFKAIAIEKKMSYRHFLRLHDKAILDFETIYGNVFE
jgi:regulator of replication initiation timing